ENQVREFLHGSFATRADGESHPDRLFPRHSEIQRLHGVVNKGEVARFLARAGDSQWLSSQHPQHEVGDYVPVLTWILTRPKRVEEPQDDRWEAVMVVEEVDVLLAQEFGDRVGRIERIRGGILARNGACVAVNAR